MRGGPESNVRPGFAHLAFEVPAEVAEMIKKRGFFGYAKGKVES